MPFTMRRAAIASTLALLAVATPDVAISSSHKKRAPEPQLQALIPLAIGAGVGVVSLGALAGAANQYAAGQECRCNPALAPSAPCTSSPCECQNNAAISCWAREQGRCKINLRVCPATNGQGGAPTALNSEFPPCASGLPPCQSGKICQKLDSTCREGRNGVSGCIGLCIPRFQTQPVSQGPPGGNNKGGNNFKNQGGSWFQGNKNGGKGPGGPSFGAGAGGRAPRCPANYACKADEVCIADPRAPQVTFKCIANSNSCGGFQNTPCPEGQLCVADPRNFCSGAGCQGLCA